MKFGIVFALIMSMINFFMGIAILFTTLLTELSIVFARSRKSKAFIGSALFSGYTGVSALLITKLFLSDSFVAFSFWWIIIVGCICLIFGVAGTTFAKAIMPRLNKGTYHEFDEQAEEKKIKK
jgi:hypothetical protein